NYDFDDMYYSGIHNSANSSGVYNYYDPPGGAEEAQYALVRNRLVDLQPYNSSVALIYEEGSLPVDLDPQYLTNVDYMEGYKLSGSLSNTHNDDSQYYKMASDSLGGNRYIIAYFETSPAYQGRDFYLSCDIATDSGVSGQLFVNGELIVEDPHINFDHLFISDVNTILFTASRFSTQQFFSNIYYFHLGVVSESSPAIQGASVTELEPILLNQSTYLTTYKSLYGTYGFEFTYKLPVISRDSLDSI
ncbi:unnamed protein product, partial [marine sediment metagenome]